MIKMVLGLALFGLVGYFAVAVSIETKTHDRAAVILERDLEERRNARLKVREQIDKAWRNVPE